MLSSPPDRVVYNALLICSYHDVYKPALAPHVIGLGTGAALLGELVATGSAVIWHRNGRDLVAADPRNPAPTDSLGLWLYEHLRAETESLPVRDWLAYFTTGDADVYTRVAKHMVLTGYMRRTEASRGRLRRKSVTVFEPVDPLIAYAPMTMLRLPLQKPDEPLEPRQAFLMGLTEAVGLAGSLYAEIDSAGRQRARRAQETLPASLRTLLGHLAAAVADTAMTAGH